MDDGYHASTPSIPIAFHVCSCDLSGEVCFLYGVLDMVKLHACLLFDIHSLFRHMNFINIWCKSSNINWVETILYFSCLQDSDVGAYKIITCNLAIREWAKFMLRCMVKYYYLHEILHRCYWEFSDYMHPSTSTIIWTAWMWKSIKIACLNVCKSLWTKQTYLNDVSH